MFRWSYIAGYKHEKKQEFCGEYPTVRTGHKSLVVTHQQPTIIPSCKNQNRQKGSEKEIIPVS
jgi:hypothetical protein